MLAKTTVTNTETTVYTVPTGKTAFVFVDIYTETKSPFTVKIDTITFYNEVGGVADFISMKMVLSASTAVKVSTTGTVNVFVHGIEV